MQIRNKWNWLIFVMEPLGYLLKFSLVTCALLAGCIAADDIEVSFSKIFKVAIISEFIFIIPAFVKVIWFGFFHTHYNFQDVQQFYPLSVASFLNLNDVPSWSVPVLLSINLFEVVYCFLLAAGMSLMTGKSFSWAVKLVTVSYGVAWLLYQTLIVFLGINMS